MVQVYLELSVLIALASPLDSIHNQTADFLDGVRRLGFELVSCRQAVEMDLAIGVAKRPLRVTDALKILEAIDVYGIELLGPHSRTLLLLVNEYLKETSLARALQALWSASTRKIFLKPESSLKVDLFLDQLVMCHTIDFRNRLEVDFPTIPLAELLLEKTQIVNLTIKDIRDVLVLLYEHNVGESDTDIINAERIAEILSEDWGFYYTVTKNLEKIFNTLKNYQHCFENKGTEEIRKKINSLLEIIEKRPKSVKWRLRAKVGSKKQWYREVQDIEG